MKRILFVAIVAVALLGMLAGTAFALGSGMDGYPGILNDPPNAGDYNQRGGGLYRVPAGSPHGNFSDASHNCAVCHSVHWANPNGEALLMDKVENACIYCHVDPGTAGYTQIYGGSAGNYNRADTNWQPLSENRAHNAPSATCGGCHQVHAASAQMVTAGNGYGATVSFLVQKILRVSGTGSDLLDSKSNVISFSAADNAGGDANEIAVSKWCTRCHASGGNNVGYFNQGYGTQAHVMTYATDGYVSPTYPDPIGRIATSDSYACSSCHHTANTQINVTLPGVVTVSNFNFPHYTDGERFLSSNGGVPATDSHADGVCLNCHQDGTTMSSGIGKGW